MTPGGVERPCPACGGRECEFAFSDINRREGIASSGTYYRCSDCKTLFLAPLPDLEELTAAYSSGRAHPVHFDESRPPQAVAREAPVATARARVLTALSRMIRGRPHSWPEEPGRGRRILDFGCGPGVKLIEFYQRGWSVAGVDLNVHAIAHARALMPDGEWFAGPIEGLPNVEPFDVIRSDNVVEHLPDPLEVLTALRKRLSQDGRLLVYVPSGESLSIRMLGGRSQASWIPFHLQLFSRRGVGILFRRAGFGEVDIHGYTPTSWWELNARQLLASPGFVNRKPGLDEYAAMKLAQFLSPLWFAISRGSAAEELVVDARG